MVFFSKVVWLYAWSDNSTVARSMRDGEWDQIFPESMILLSYNGVVNMVRID